MISCYGKYIEIKLLQNSKFLSKALAYTDKYFASKYNLSTSVLILHYGENIKKKYLINWCYHANSIDINDNYLDNVMKKSHLPLRIKIVKQYDALEKINIKIQVLSSTRVTLILNKDNRIAKRYIKTVFYNSYVGSHLNEIYLSVDSEIFWKKLLNFVGDKIIHNTVLSFEYEGFSNIKTTITDDENSSSSFEEDLCFCESEEDEEELSFFTKAEKELIFSYKVLDSSIYDSFLVVKKRYLRLAKQYHPDNVYGKNQNLISEYAEKFREINQAYEKIKSSLFQY